MDYLGRAAAPKFITKINGTHELTFQMPDKFFDNKEGKYVKNEFIDKLFNESKIKLFYKKKWYEFYIKTVKEDKKYKSYMKTYTCTDSFIDELSRNGYGITFDTDLYNNVEEIGTFTEEILDDSIWYYDPVYNWGDFTEYQQEKLFKIPVSIFNSKVIGHKLIYVIENSTKEIKNIFNHKKRPLEMGDDLSRVEEYFWDGRTETKDDNDNYIISMPLVSNTVEQIDNDGYIYVPYSCLDFCYKTTKTGLTATEEVQYYDEKSYAIAPNTIDPNYLIQFLAIPKDATVEIDEAGLIINKNFSYVMTVSEWNQLLEGPSQYFYEFSPLQGKEKNFLTAEEAMEYTPAHRNIVGNWCAYYDGYLDKINSIEVLYGKKISVTDRTAINISPEIDQYITVYNNHCDEYKDYYINLDNNWKDSKEFLGEEDEEFDKSYRVCSKIDTRQIIPQLARNLIQNGISIKNTDGWQVQKNPTGNTDTSAKITFKKSDIDNSGSLIIEPAIINTDSTDDAFNTILNFGLVGQNITVSPEHYYCFGIQGQFPESISDLEIILGKGGVISNGNYSLEKKYYFTLTTSSSEGEINTYCLLKFPTAIENPYFAIKINSKIILNNIEFFEAYTKGIDQFDNAIYKYSGRDLISCPLDQDETYTDFFISKIIDNQSMRQYIIFENDVMSGDTYEYKKYFIQQIQAKTTENDTVVKQLADTFNAKEFLSPDGVEYLNRNIKNLSLHQLPFSSKNFTDNELVIATKYIDLNKCKYYTPNATIDGCDCSFNGKDRICMYQKYGYCPYLFQTEKHCRKIRTLSQSKSNRFNLTQELSKVFEVYPIYYTSHDERGKINTIYVDESIDSVTGDVVPAHYKMDKKIFYITEKGVENKLGFRYELNLQNISRTIKSDKIVTKLYVQDTDSSLSKTGLCSIKTAEDNPSKDSFIIDFSYYTAKGILNKTDVDNDLYGATDTDMGYLKQLGHFNNEYDILSNAIINLSSNSFTELEANINVDYDGIETAQKQLRKYIDQANKYYKLNIPDEDQSQSWKNYQTKIAEQQAILNGLIKELLCDENNQYLDIITGEKRSDGYEKFFDEISIQEFKETSWVKDHIYSLGMLGQFNTEYLQIEEWKKQQAAYLQEINKLSLKFFRKYEPYLKEGTWSDSNYLTDNAYYFGAKEVSAEGAIPKVEYSINVIDLYNLPEYKDYNFEVADTTYVEDIGMFGINKITGLPNRLKTIISETSDSLDEPKGESIKVQNFTTQFEDLFSQVTASVQSLTYNENIYKRSSNFTSNQNISEDSLQGTLDNNNVTLLDTQEKNIELNKDGQSGSDLNNHSNKYKLNGQGMFFSNNGGQSWDIGVGPSGINADYIKVGTLDAGKIRIVDNDYLYFFWDKAGIVALRDPSDTSGVTGDDYTVFNRHGLSVIENGKIRLRSGYSYIGENGKYDQEAAQGNALGFFLYDNQGRVIFNTSSDNANGANSAVLQLKGEMQVGDNLSNYEMIYYTYQNPKMKLVTKQVTKIKIFSESIFNTYERNGDSLTTYCKQFLEGSRAFESSLTFTHDEEEVTVNFSISSGHSIIFNNRYYELDKLIVTIVGDQITQELYFITPNLLEYDSTIRIQQSVEIPSSEQTLTSVSLVDSREVTVFYYNSSGIYIEETFTAYVFSSVDSTIYYLNRQESESTITQQGGINVYINNRDMNKNIFPAGYGKRIFSCLQTSGQPQSVFNNLFTILSDGNLYIGGRMIQNDSSTTVSNYLKFDESSVDQTIRIIGGRLYVGSSDIVSYFEDKIEEIGGKIAELGTVDHWHDLIWQTGEGNPPSEDPSVDSGTDTNWPYVRINNTNYYVKSLPAGTKETHIIQEGD